MNKGKRIISIFLCVSIFITILPIITLFSSAAESWLWPVENCYIISSNYGFRSWTDQDGYHEGNHAGIDIIGSNGTYSKPVRAAKSGTIYDSCNSIADDTFISGSCGNYVAINHEDGTYSIYMHLRPIGVKTSGIVSQGEIIGFIGNTGESYGAHLHFQMYTNPNYRNESTLNPMPTNSGITINHEYILPSGWPSTKTTYLLPASDPTKPPTIAILTTDYKAYAVDEDVVFSIATDGNVNNLWIYCPNGQTLPYTDVGYQYSLPFGMQGHYQALVQTWNGAGSFTSERIDFVVGPPTYASLSTDKKSYDRDERVYFTADSDGNTNTLWIYCPNGETRHFSDIGTSYDLGFGMLGHYQALVQTWNGQGSFSSERIDFVVGPPTYATITSDKTTYAVGETATFTCDSDGNTNTVWIYYPDGTSEYFQHIDDLMTHTMTMEGDYEALVQAWNTVGSLISDRISFTVGCDHSYSSVSTAPTCTEQGYTTYTCSKCGDSYVDNYVPALEHDYRAVVTDPTCTEEGYTTHTCSRCGSCYLDTFIEPLGHNYVDGVCTVCGAIKTGIASAYPVLNEGIDLVYGVFVPDGYYNAKIVFSGPNGTETVTDYSYANGKNYYSYTGITPQCIGDTITATLYATKNGTEEAVDVKTYSVRQYCVNMLAKESISTELRTLISDLLAYGAAAQAYTGYHTDAYADTGSDLSNPTPSTFSALSGKGASFTGTANETYQWISAGLTLRSNVAMNFRFYAESVDKLRIRIGINGRRQTFSASDFIAVPGEENVYEISFSGISAEEFADDVTATFLSGSTQVGNVVAYSVNAYVCSTQNSNDTALRALVRALYNYGASASEFALAN